MNTGSRCINTGSSQDPVTLHCLGQNQTGASCETGTLVYPWILMGFCMGLVVLEDVIQGHFFLCQLVQKWLSYSFCKFEVSSTKTGVTVLSQTTTGRKNP